MIHVAGSPSEGWPPVTTVLDRLSPHLRARVVPLATSVRHASGSVILREGVDTPFLGVIEEGRVALRLRVPERGDPVTIVTIEAGELLGWSAVVAPYRATVDAIATAPTRLLAIEAAALRGLLAADCELAAELLPHVLDAVSGRLTASWSQLLDLFGSEAAEPW